MVSWCREGLHHPSFTELTTRAINRADIAQCRISVIPRAGDLVCIFQDTATRPNKNAGAASRRMEGKEPCFNHASA